jgi:hypothetical protein
MRLTSPSAERPINQDVCQKLTKDTITLHHGEEVISAFGKQALANQFLPRLAFDREGHMFGVTTTVNHSPVPAILYRIHPATGAATKDRQSRGK